MTEQERKTRGPAGPHRGGQGRVGLPGRGGREVLGASHGSITLPTAHLVLGTCGQGLARHWEGPE